MPDGKSYDRNDFIKTFNNIARHRHRYEVFWDFVTMSAISLHNAVNMNGANGAGISANRWSVQKRRSL